MSLQPGFRFLDDVDVDQAVRFEQFQFRGKLLLADCTGGKHDSFCFYAVREHRGLFVPPRDLGGPKFGVGRVTHEKQASRGGVRMEMGSGQEHCRWNPVRLPPRVRAAVRFLEHLEKPVAPLQNVSSVDLSAHAQHAPAPLIRRHLECLLER